MKWYERHVKRNEPDIVGKLASIVSPCQFLMLFDIMKESGYRKLKDIADVLGVRPNFITGVIKGYWKFSLSSWENVLRNLYKKEPRIFLEFTRAVKDIIEAFLVKVAELKTLEE